MHPKLLNPLTIKSVSRDERGFLILDGELASAAKINARLVADFEPGILNRALIGLLAADNPFRKGAGQFVISTSLPSDLCVRLRFIAAQRAPAGINQPIQWFKFYERTLSARWSI